MRIIKILAPLVLFFGLVQSAFAVYDGLYLGLQVGQIHSNFQAQTFTGIGLDGVPRTVTVSPSNSVYAGRIYWGYQFSKFLALENGFLYSQPINYNTRLQVLCDRPSVRVTIIDLLAKISYSFTFNNSACAGSICRTSCEPSFESYFENAGLGAYLKVGPALVHTHFSGSLKETGGFCTGAPSKNRVVGEAALGFEMFLTKKFSIDLSYTRYFSGNNYPGANFVALGMTYRFVDTCCGQFLCD